MMAFKIIYSPYLSTLDDDAINRSNADHKIGK